MSKRIKEKCLVFRFSFSIWNDSIYIYSIIIYLDNAISGCLLLLIGIYIYTKNGTNKKNDNFRLFVADGKWKRNGKFPLVCCKRNGKRKFVLLGRQTKAVIDDFCFSKLAHPQERTWRKGISKQTDSIQSLYILYSTGWFVFSIRTTCRFGFRLVYTFNDTGRFRQCHEYYSA